MKTKVNVVGQCEFGGFRAIKILEQGLILVCATQWVGRQQPRIALAPFDSGYQDWNEKMSGSTGTVEFGGEGSQISDRWLSH
jgi:hypothetical protein